jgi:hypothetical protein
MRDGVRQVIQTRIDHLDDEIAKGRLYRTQLEAALTDINKQIASNIMERTELKEELCSQPSEDS